MGRYVLRRILYAIPIAFGVSVVCFSLVYLAPGDPLQTVLPPDATAETVEIVKKAYGFDKPLPVQFAFFTGYAMGAIAGCFPGRWVDRVVTGTAVLGVSLPNYWVGIVLVIVFAVELMVLPAAGMGPSGSSDFRVLHWGDAK